MRMILSTITTKIGTLCEIVNTLLHAVEGVKKVTDTKTFRQSAFRHGVTEADIRWASGQKRVADTGGM